MRDAYLKLCDGLAAVARIGIKVLMAAMTVDVLLGVFFRYILRDALTWTEETARYLMIWMGFLGVGLVLREGGHVAVQFLAHKMPPTARQAMTWVVRLLTLSFLLSVVGAGILLTARVSSQRTPVLAISMMWPYLAIPTGCLLTALELVALMIRDPHGQGTLDPVHADTGQGSGG